MVVSPGMAIMPCQNKPSIVPCVALTPARRQQNIKRPTHGTDKKIIRSPHRLCRMQSPGSSLRKGRADAGRKRLSASGENSTMLHCAEPWGDHSSRGHDIARGEYSGVRRICHAAVWEAPPGQVAKWSCLGGQSMSASHDQSPSLTPHYNHPSTPYPSTPQPPLTILLSSALQYVTVVYTCAVLHPPANMHTYTGLWICH